MSRYRAKTLLCEFDEGKPCPQEADFLVSRRDENERFRSEAAFCLRHFVAYAQVLSEEQVIAR